ncbi:hypothetical protein PF005_g14963 [Phytophthora fragariae]|uniref:Uncharacterized protein n=1 Tax=Phytophthora fragariae TaxID=53985 RepID=A0A6A3S983_9STRA|nr:hypothetical protein PF003_g35389 [Phytophthora fragariae]KAE8927035.1 hypothetical protein PF009_g22789 [Phytophthora fragariae]KAE9000711.1 hypothetical protein PF011_g14066 [Phytophthora fragariae]KAE9083291.1 hypothetical protein PF010_g21267 [Phytophthora fragariae]KAE9107989.1 hypothetical protein PF006_g20977 [Phytophthora fragariae]
MKARSNAKLMTRRQARLWEQRRLLHVQQLQAAARSELANQQWVRAHPDSRTSSWWNCDDGGEGIRLDTTCSNSSCSLYLRGTGVAATPTNNHGEVERMQTMMDGSGYQSGSTTGYSNSAESWRDLLVEKASNRALEESGPVIVTDGVEGRQLLDAYDRRRVGHDGRQVAAGGERIHSATPHEGDLGRDESRCDELGTEWTV